MNSASTPIEKPDNQARTRASAQDRMSGCDLAAAAPTFSRSRTIMRWATCYSHPLDHLSRSPDLQQRLTAALPSWTNL